jgi:hypothetical protein
MLSSKSLDGLVSCSAGVYGVDAAKWRATAREAVAAAAKELGIDPLTPPLPRFAAGEDEVAAAVRVLKLPIEKELEKHRARADACRVAAERIAGLEHRHAQLERVEHGRQHDQIMAGKVPGPAPAQAIAEQQAVAAELALSPSSARITEFVSESEKSIIRAAAERPDVLPSVVFYCDLVAERLLMLTDDEPHNSVARSTARRAAATPRAFASRVNNGTDRELDAIVRRVRRAVDLADLHRRQEREQRETTIEQLEAVRAVR